MTSADSRLPSEIHQTILREKIIPQSGLDGRTSFETPNAVILAGQPGAGKGSLARQVRQELLDDVITIDPDRLRDQYEPVQSLREKYP